jgi:WD40 repeat protein
MFLTNTILGAAKELPLLVYFNSERDIPLQTAECIKTLEGHRDWAWCVGLTADGRRVVSRSPDSTLRVWDLQTGESVRTLEGTKGVVCSAALTADGRRVVSAGNDCRLRVWDAQTGQCLKELGRLQGAYTVEFSFVALSADGRFAVSGHDDSLRVWDLETGQCLKTLEGHEDKAPTTPAELSVYLMSIAVSEVCITKDGQRAVSVSAGGRLRVWDLEAGQCLRTLGGYTDRTALVELMIDERRALSGGYDNALRIWDLETGQCLRTLQGHTNSITSVALMRDGRRALSGSSDNTLRVWDLETGQCLAVAHVDGFSVVSVGRVIVAGTRHGLVDVLHLSTEPPAPPLVTAVRVWHFGDSPKRGRWDDHLSVICYWCGQRFRVEAPTQANPAGFTCPVAGCGQPLRLSPLVCDRRPRGWSRLTQWLKSPAFKSRN